jgi:hypothetical protein
MSARARGWALIVLAFVLLIAAGITYLGPNRLVLTGKQTIAEVVESTPGEPSSMTVEFTTEDGQTVQASTSRLYALPPVGAAVRIRYDPDDPSQVADDLYRESSPPSTLLVIAATMSVGGAVVTWRRGKAERRAT